MTPERWQQIKELMNRVMEVSPAERLPLLDTLCGTDHVLRDEVKSLIATLDNDDSLNDEMRRAVVAEAKLVSSARRATDNDALVRELQQQLGESYEILSVLGSGGMGTVFLARERALDRYVAIKTLRDDQSSTAHYRERFQREARIAAQLSHPGILPLHAFGEIGGLCYLVMSYVRGQTLEQLLRAQGRLHADEARRILSALSDAVQHAHSRNVIHRDIKPANILIDAEHQRVLLADFGISKVLNEDVSLTRTGDVLGTPHFMSPEQSVDANNCDERSDVYSIGAVGYAMLAGRAPMANVHDADVAAKRAVTPITSLRDIAPSTPPDLAAIVMRCLARNPADRWSSAHEISAALQRVDHSIDADVAPALRDVAGFGAYSMGWFAVWAAFALNAGSSRERALLWLMSTLVPIGLALHVARVIGAATPPRQIFQVSFWPPLWWGMWWPRALRRPADVWKQLPWPAQSVRVIMSVFTASLPVLAFGGSALGLIGADGRDALWYAIVSALACAALLALAGGGWWARQFDLRLGDTLHLLVGPTAPSAFWSKPEVARVLAAPSHSVRPPLVTVAADYVRALDELQHIAPQKLFAASSAAALIRELAEAIAKREHEIALVDRDAPAAEISRVAVRLAGLRQHVVSPSREHSALLAAVETESEMLRQLAQRKMLAQNVVAELFTTLRELWSEISRPASISNDDVQARMRAEQLLERGRALLDRSTASRRS